MANIDKQGELDKILGVAGIGSTKNTIPKDALEELLREELTPDITSVPMATLRRYAESTNEEDKLMAATNIGATSEMLKRLSICEYTSVRKAVAMHPNTPVETLTILSDDVRFEVRLRAAKNIHTPMKTLLKLAGDSDMYIKAAVASNPNATAEILMVLFIEAEPIVLKEIAKHNNTPIFLLEKIIRMYDPDITAEASKNPNYEKTFIDIRMTD